MSRKLSRLIALHGATSKGDVKKLRQRVIDSNLGRRAKRLPKASKARVLKECAKLAASFLGMSPEERQRMLSPANVRLIKMGAAILENKGVRKQRRKR